MKKVLILFLLVLSVFIQKAYAVSFEDAMTQSSNRPAIAFVYAKWADDYDTYLSKFRAATAKIDPKYNVVEVDIATEDGKAYNGIYDIYARLPYVFLFKSNGKVTRFLDKKCISDENCIISKSRTFMY